jgi:hypothetical protein
MVMRPLAACLVGAFICAVLAAVAGARDLGERDQMTGADPFRDGARAAELQKPLRLLAPEGVREHEATAARQFTEGAHTGSNGQQTLRGRRRPHMHAMPRGQSERQIKLRQKQQGPRPTD